jgi:hypothetical protein
MLGRDAALRLPMSLAHTSGPAWRILPEGKEADILCQVHTRYKEFVVLYLELLKALYGCVQSALLWYNLFTGTLEGMGLKLNPYDPCVANLMIHGKQCTIPLFVNDNKILQVD